MPHSIQPFANVFGKALHHARCTLKQALPATPGHREAVCWRLIGGTYEERECATPCGHGGQKPIPKEIIIISQVLNLYERDDIRQQAYLCGFHHRIA